MREFFASLICHTTRQWAISRLLARISLPPFNYHIYAYDAAPGSTAAPTSSTSHLYQRPEIKHETELHAVNEPTNANVVNDRYKGNTEVQTIFG